MSLTFEDRLIITLIGTTVSGIIAFIIWFKKESIKDKRKRDNILRIIRADIRSTMGYFEKIPTFERIFFRLKEGDDIPLLLFNPTRYSDFFIDFKDDVYLVPSHLTELILDYYDSVSACTLVCKTFEGDEFKAFSFKRKKNAYIKWVDYLKEAKNKGRDLLNKLEFEIKVI